MADYITPEQAKALQDQYNQALADADNLNQQYQNNMNGNTQTTTTGNPTQSEMDAMKDLYPNLQYPSDYNNTNTTQTPPNTTANNDPWSWNNTPTTPTTSTPTNNTPGLTLDDYYAYYGYDYTKADKDYNQWVTWMQSQTPTTPTTTQPTTPTNPTNPTNPSTPTTTTTQGTSVDDYVNYYKNLGMTTPDKDYETWVAWIQSGGDTQNPTNPSSPSNPTNPSNPSTPTTTQGTSVQDYINYWVSRGVTTPPMDYNTWVTYINNGGDPSNPGSGTPVSNIPGGNVTHNYPTVDMDNRQRISDMYDAQIEAQRAALQEQGDQALSDAQANLDKIASLYNKQRNAASVDWERQRRNFLEGANTSGLNTGAGSQAELSMMSAYQRSQNDLGAAQAQAEAEADRNIADIKRSTQASINEAIAKNDYQKAAALLDEYNAQYNRAVERAEALGQYGDFSGYAALYGDEAAAQMRQTWIMSNPEVALAMGLITQSQYAALTLYKQYPALALTGGTGFSGGGVDYSGGGDVSTSTPANTGNIPSYSGMTPGTYAAIINSMIASGQIQGEDVAKAQDLIKQAYAQGG